MKQRTRKRSLVGKNLSSLHHYTEQKVIKCNNCGTNYKTWSGSQAAGCASYIEKKKGYITCHYGSEFDTLRFMVKTLALRGKVVCDTCIRRELFYNRIERDENFNFWQPVEEYNKVFSQYQRDITTLVTSSLWETVPHEKVE